MSIKELRRIVACATHIYTQQVNKDTFTYNVESPLGCVVISKSSDEILYSYDSWVSGKIGMLSQIFPDECDIRKPELKELLSSDIKCIGIFGSFMKNTRRIIL